MQKAKQISKFQIASNAFDYITKQVDDRRSFGRVPYIEWHFKYFVSYRVMRI